jgi:hypothetical protein
LHGKWNVSPNGTYYKDEIIKAEFTVSTGSSTDSYVAIFTDSTTRLQVQFRLPNYRYSITNEQGKLKNEELGEVMLGHEIQK